MYCVEPLKNLSLKLVKAPSAIGTLISSFANLSKTANVLKREVHGDVDLKQISFFSHTV